MKTFLTGLEKLISGTSSVFLLVVTIAAIVQVIFRYVFNSPISWSEELARAAFGWAMLLACSMTMKADGHLKVDIVRAMVSKKSKDILDIISLVFTIIFLALFFYYSTLSTIKAFHRGMVTTALEIPIWTLWLCMPVGCLLTGLQAVIHLFKKLTAKTGSEANATFENGEKQ